MLKYLLIYIIFKFNLCENNLTKLNINTTIYNNNISHFNYISNINQYRKNLLVGIISRYSWETVLPFFKSFIKANFFNCDVVIFVRHVSESLIKNLEMLGVFVERIPQKYNNISTINIRWKLYADFLKEKREKYNLVFSADIRDTIFQEDVFNYYKNNGPFLGVAIEDGTLNQRLNKKWIISFCGEKIHETIMTERIICVGSIWGTSQIFFEFSNLFFQKLLEYPNSIEQGIANYLFYHEKFFSDYLVKSDNYGPVMTIGLTERSNINLDSKGNILNFNGKIAAVIHQYDRKKDIVRIIIKKFCPQILKPFISNNDNFVNKDEINIGINKAIKNNYTGKIAKSERNIHFFYWNVELFTILLLIKSWLSQNKLKQLKFKD